MGVITCCAKTADPVSRRTKQSVALLIFLMTLVPQESEKVISSIRGSLAVSRNAIQS